MRLYPVLPYKLMLVPSERMVKESLLIKVHCVNVILVKNMLQELPICIEVVCSMKDIAVSHCSMLDVCSVVVRPMLYEVHVLDLDFF
jgi:hypothetical protein